MKSKGIDVSHHNGKINWDKVRASGMEFAYIRMGYAGYEGEIHLDRCFYENIEGAARAGLKTGVYIYSYNRDIASAKKTALEAVRLLRGRKLQLPIAFDVEETGHDIFTSKGRKENSRLVKTFLEALNSIGERGILYTYTNFAKNYLDMDMLSDIDLWIADYRDEKGLKCPYDGDFAIWQYKGSDGRCDGVEGPCDLNLCFKDFDEKEINYKEKYESLKKAVAELLEKYEKITAS